MKLISVVVLSLAMHASFGQSMGLALEGDEWNSVRALPVKGRTGILIKQKLSFGEYRTGIVDRSWSKGTALTKGVSVGTPTDEFYQKVITTDVVDKNQALFFSLEDEAGNQSRAYCVSRFHSRDFNIGNSPVSALNLLLDIAGKGGESSSVFFVKIYGEDPQDGWELFIDNQQGVQEPDAYTGYLVQNNGEHYTLTPATKVKSRKGKIGRMPFGSAGYEIRRGNGQAVAAVSLIDQGIVYLQDVDAKERILLATACAALLLQEQIEE